MLSGVLVVDKPAGPTSHDVVDRVRAALGEKRAGHTGTLDPFATGVLPVCVGKATRLVRFLAEGDKVYRATVRLGFATATDDALGEPLGTPREVRADASFAIIAPLEALTTVTLRAGTPPAIRRRTPSTTCAAALVASVPLARTSAITVKPGCASAATISSYW